MKKSEKVTFRKSYILDFNISLQTFDRRRKEFNFSDFNGAERKWAFNYLNENGYQVDSIEELFPILETINN